MLNVEFVILLEMNLFEWHQMMLIISIINEWSLLIAVDSSRLFRLRLFSMLNAKHTVQ